MAWRSSALQVGSPVANVTMDMVCVDAVRCPISSYLAPRVGVHCVHFKGSWMPIWHHGHLSDGCSRCLSKEWPILPLAATSCSIGGREKGANVSTRSGKSNRASVVAYRGFAEFSPALTLLTSLPPTSPVGINHFHQSRSKSAYLTALMTRAEAIAMLPRRATACPSPATTDSAARMPITVGLA